MKRKLTSLLLAFALSLGLSAGAWAADDPSGKSYAVAGGVIHLFAPDGYEGTETIPLPSDYCGHTGHTVTWTVEDGAGILKLNHCGSYGSFDWYGISIEGSGNLTAAAVELQASSPYFTYSYIDASGVDLTLCSAPGGPRQELMLRANYGGASHPEGNVAVEDGDLLIRNLYLSTAADIREYDNYRRAAMRQINVPDGSVTVDENSYLSTYSSSVWNSYDSSSGVLTIDSPAADDVHILAKALIVEGTCSAWSRGQENVRGNIISAPSIRFENCYVSITQTGGERRGRFQSTPVCADPSKAVETQEDNGWNTDYYYVYNNMPQDSRPVPAFTDVAEDAWYYENVRYACQAGLMQGKSSTTFAPNDELTVAEAVKLACCIHQWEQERRVTLTNGSPWYATYMDYALEKGIIVEDLSARANKPITRQEYILMFDRAIPDELPEINTVEDGAIPDVNMGGGTEAIIYKFYRAGILTGGTGGAFLPDSPIKRSEVCAVLTRIMDPDSRVSFTLTA